MLRWITVAFTAFLSGCTNAAMDAVNALVPSGSYRLDAGLPYGSDPRQILDVYRPKADGQGVRPVVLFFYGGSWKFGSRTQYKFLGEAFASHGIVTVIADYRVYPAVKFPAFVNDGAHALQWVRTHIEAYGGNGRGIYLMGHSAGAHIAALVALDPSYAAAAGAENAVHGFIGLAGPYAFHPEQTENVRDVFLGTGDLERARPINYARGGKDLAVFLAHGRADTTVLPANTEQLTSQINAYGGSARAVFYDDIGHIGIMAAFARPFRKRAPVLNDVVKFIQETQAFQASQ